MSHKESSELRWKIFDCPLSLFLFLILWIRIRIYLEYGSTKLLNTNPIWIRIHNADENFNYDGLKITQSLSPTNIRKIGARLLPVPIRYGRYLQETNYSLNVLSVYHKY